MTISYRAEPDEVRAEFLAGAPSHGYVPGGALPDPVPVYTLGLDSASALAEPVMAAWRYLVVDGGRVVLTVDVGTDPVRLRGSCSGGLTLAGLTLAVGRAESDLSSLDGEWEIRILDVPALPASVLWLRHGVEDRFYTAYGPRLPDGPHGGFWERLAAAARAALSPA